MIQVILLNQTEKKNIPQKKKFQLWIDLMTKKISEKVPLGVKEICITVVDEASSAYLNKTYRHHNGPTNVLSFHYDAMPGQSSQSLGDLAICATLVKTEALAASKRMEAHWAHLTIHGALHLLGYDHQVEKDATIMETLEINLLAALGFEDPYK